MRSRKSLAHLRCFGDSTVLDCHPQDSYKVTSKLSIPAIPTQLHAQDHSLYKAAPHLPSKYYTYMSGEVEQSSIESAKIASNLPASHHQKEEKLHATRPSLQDGKGMIY